MTRSRVEVAPALARPDGVGNFFTTAVIYNIGRRTCWATQPIKRLAPSQPHGASWPPILRPPIDPPRYGGLLVCGRGFDDGPSFPG